MRALRCLACGLTVCLLAGPVPATELGDAAPPLKVEKWIKGGPIDLKAGRGKNIYVIEFWATWCGPCRRSIPHLTEVQQKYKDKGVVIVGVSIDEDKKRKTRKDVEPFVETMGEKMDFAVALDDADGSTDKAYMKEFVVEGIPTAFIIDQAGQIVWLGHPDELEEPLQQVIAGKYDLAAAKKAEKERRAEAEKRVEARKMMDKYFALVSESDKPAGAEALGMQTLEALGKDASLLNSFAWDLLTSEEIKFRDLKLALRAAKAAYDACEGKNAAVVDTYARALWDSGQQQEAIRFQRQAVALAGENEELKEELQQTLARYEKEAAGK